MNYGLDFAVRFYDHFGLGGLVVEVIYIIHPYKLWGIPSPLYMVLYSSKRVIFVDICK